MVSKVIKRQKLEKYHYSAYKNLVVTLVTLNSAGIGASLAFMHLITNAACLERKEETLCKVLEQALDSFGIGLLLIVIEIYIEYLSYFLHARCIKRQEVNLTSGELCYEKIFSFIQFILLIASGLFLLTGGIYFVGADVFRK